VLIFLDGARFIEEAITSVVDQAGFDAWELVLVDDGSSDGSTEIAKRWAASDPARIRYVDHTDHQNRGMSASRNLGVDVARGVYVAFLDCDDVWLPSALAHRMRVAAAFPTADLVVGGTWRWHGWTGTAADRALDRRMTLPAAPPYQPLLPPRLFAAIYGIPGGGYVPAMCSVVLRRESLLALGAFESEFRGLYEDQVLYVKAGLRLTAVIDPRPLALYRQHPRSACEVSLAEGSWRRIGPSASATRFFTWMRSYVDGEMGRRSKESRIVARNIAHNRKRLDQLDRRPQDRLRRLAPDRVRTMVRSSRRRWRPSSPEQPPSSVLSEWSSQHLQPITAAMWGTVLVVLPAHHEREPWTAVIPRNAFGAAADVVTSRLQDVDGAACFDHILVPFEAARATPADSLLRALRPVLRPDGSLTALLPGLAYRPPLRSGTTPTGAGARSAEVLAVARRIFPAARISVETFGNALTAQAAAAGSPAREVIGAAMDHHDQLTDVLVTLGISGNHDARTAEEIEP
jgi:glycosyltransferase involved in cell wall biosynthesis